MGSIRQKMSAVCFEVQGDWFAISLGMIEGVAALPEIIAVPGNQSRIFVGLAYVLGQIVSVVDIAPLFNLGTARDANELLILQVASEYYALRVRTVGGIVSNAKLTAIKKTLNESARATLWYGKKKAKLIDVETLVKKYVCS